MLGTTWYDRGLSYWLRRVGLIVMMALVIALVTALLVGLFSAIRQTSLTGFYIALIIEVTYSLAIIVFVAVWLARRWNNMGEVQKRPVSIRAAGSAGVVVGTLAQSGFLIGQLFLVVGSLLFFGLYVAVFLAMFMPEIFWERPARCRLAKRLRSGGYDVSVS